MEKYRWALIGRSEVAALILNKGGSRRIFGQLILRPFTRSTTDRDSFVSFSKVNRRNPDQDTQKRR